MSNGKGDTQRTVSSGKGDTPRPLSVSREDFKDRWDLTFLLARSVQLAQEKRAAAEAAQTQPDEGKEIE